MGEKKKAVGPWIECMVMDTYDLFKKLSNGAKYKKSRTSKELEVRIAHSHLWITTCIVVLSRDHVVIFISNVIG